MNNNQEPKREQRWLHPLHARGVRCSMRGLGNAVGGTLSEKRIRKLLEEGFYGKEKKEQWLKIKTEVLAQERKAKKALKEGE